MAQVAPTVPHTAAMKNVNHNLISTLDNKLDAVWRYDTYIQDARQQGCMDCVRVLEQLKQEEIRQIQMLREEIAKHVQKGQFD